LSEACASRAMGVMKLLLPMSILSSIFIL
jgi:hypothetical protein